MADRRCFQDLLENIEEATNSLDAKRINETQMDKLLEQMGKLLEQIETTIKKLKGR